MTTTISKKEVRKTIYQTITKSLLTLEIAPPTSTKVSKLLQKASKKIAKQITAHTKRQAKQLKTEGKTTKTKNSVIC